MDLGEALEWDCLGEAVDGAGQGVALVDASGGVDVDGTCDSSVDFTAWCGVPLSHGLCDGGSGRLGGRIRCGAADRGEGGFDVEREAGVLGVGAGGCVESVVGLGGAVGDSDAKLAVADSLLDFGLSRRREGCKRDLLEEEWHRDGSDAAIAAGQGYQLGGG